jgi:hypothetical protein
MLDTQLQTFIKLRLRKEGYYYDETLSEYIMVMLHQNKTQATILNELQEFLGHETALLFTKWLWMTMEEWNEWPEHYWYSSPEKHFIKLHKSHRVLKRYVDTTTIDEKMFRSAKRLRESHFEYP